MAIKSNILEKRLGKSITGTTMADKCAKLTGFVGGAGLYNLATDDVFVCNNENFDPRERTEEGRTIQSPIFKNENRILTIGTILRKSTDGKFHPLSTGMEFLAGMELAGDACASLEGKTIKVIGVHEIDLPAYGKTELVATKQYAFAITPTV